MARYFPKVIGLLERLGAILSLYNEYEQLIANEPRFKLALTAVYRDVLTLLQKADQALKRKGITVLFRSIWTTFESEFNGGLQKLALHSSVLEAETTLAHRKYVHTALKPVVAHVERSSVTIMDQPQRRTIMTWLNAVDAASDLVQHSRRRITGTGLWLVQESKFVQWHTSDKSSILWLHGVPGAGKTVLCTSVVNSLRELYAEPQAAIAFFFFDRLDQKKRTESSLVASMLAQICAQSQNLPVPVTVAFEQAALYGRDSLCPADLPTSLLTSVIEGLGDLYLVVDGLDECEDSTSIISTLQELVEACSGVHILISSRKTPSIQRKLSTNLSIAIDATRTEQDIKIYLAAVRDHLPTSDAAWLELISRRVIERSHGMFLFAHLIMQSLLKSSSPAELTGQLEELPSGLTAFYNKHLEKLSRETATRQQLARKLLLWVCYAQRPLNWAELQVALVDGEISSGQTLPFKAAVLELGSPFVVYDELSDRFNLQHLSMRDFLVAEMAKESVDMSFFTQAETEAESQLAYVCLSQVLAASGRSHPEALTDYATMFWCDHLLVSQLSIDLLGLLTTFNGDEAIRQWWIRNMLRLGHNGFSLQKIFKLQSDLNAWLRLNDSTSQPEQAFVQIDWCKDVVHILVDAQEDSNTSIRLTYFEKIMVVRDLARLLTQSKRLDEGILWLTDAYASLSHRKAVELVWISNSLAILYDQQGETHRSLCTQQQALSIQTAELGPDHLETINTVNELGRIYRHLGDYDNAAKMHHKALAVLEARLPEPEEHLEVMWTIATLARTYRKQGRFPEALALFERAHRTRAKVLGPTHPHTLWILGDIGATYQDMGLLTNAEDSYRRALEGRQNVLGLNHPDTLWSINNYGIILERIGRRDEALDLQRRALSGQREVLGHEHKHTIWTLEAVRRLRRMDQSNMLIDCDEG